MADAPKSINYSNYSLNIEIKPDSTLPTVNKVNLTNCSIFSGARIQSFRVAKNCYDTNFIPINRLILTDINEQEFFNLSNMLVLLEITLVINGKSIYKNIYKITKAEEISAVSQTGTGDNAMVLLLDSYLTSGLKNDNNFYSISKLNKPNFYNMDIFHSMNELAIKKYGNSLGISNSISNKSISTFNNYIFNPNTSNLDNYFELVYVNKVSLDPIIFGFDEFFSSVSDTVNTPSVTTGTITELILADLLDIDDISYVNNYVSNFLKDTSYKISNAQFIEPYYSVKFIKDKLQSVYRYKNLFTNNVDELPPLINTGLILDKSDALPSVSYATSPISNYYEDEGNLSINDVQAIRENILKFLKLNPKIYRIYIDKAPVDIFKLGRKINIGNLQGNSITVAAEIEFNYEPDIALEPGEVQNTSNHVCSGSVYVLNWNKDENTTLV